ncbi:hypothetical protein LIER_20198 [Lithospermum erythrorhizon]|uniref:Transposase (putative) gypsy type domain-containing protein n=1 Tax=Lithospermum erythrorhizon TaxID=34254 RepID=A0AAV3QLJ5_LITER
MASIVNEKDIKGAFCSGWTPLFLEAFSFELCLPFSIFANNLLEHINRALGKVHPIGWLNITIFQVACEIARVQATVPLFAGFFTSKHRPFYTSTKGGKRLTKNFLADSSPNKVNQNRFNGIWFFVRGGMGLRVPIRWTSLKELGSLYVRDSAFLKSQVQMLRKTIPVKPSWKAYWEESALIMAGLIYDKIYNPYNNSPVTWPVGGSQAVDSWCDSYPCLSPKRSSTSAASASASKRAKLEALAAIAPSSSPNTHQTKIISVDDELTISAQETSGARKEKSLPPSPVRSSKAILPLLVKTGTDSKKSKGQSVALGEESSLNC